MYRSFFGMYWLYLLCIGPYLLCVDLFLVFSGLFGHVSQTSFYPRPAGVSSVFAGWKNCALMVQALCKFSITVFS